ncbi:MAG: HdeD family acid-resistance protein [Bacteroidales bacterium]
MIPLHFQRTKLIYANGVLAIIFGLIAILFPDIAIITLAVFFAIGFMLGGIFMTAGAIGGRDVIPSWELVLLKGILGITIGIVMLVLPKDVVAFFLVVAGIWAIITGLMFLFYWIRKTHSQMFRFISVVIGILSVVIGIIFIVNPFESTRVIVILIGIYALIFGIYSIINTRQQIKEFQTYSQGDLE